MASDDRSPKLPPPPRIGGASEQPAAPRIAPPELGAGKADARAVGVDTSFIDGLTAGLMDELAVGNDAPSASTPSPAPDTRDEASEDVSTSTTSPLDEANDDDLERLATRAFVAMDEDGNVATEETDEGVEAGDESDTTEAPPIPPPRAATQLATEAQPPPSAASESGVPRSWWMGGAAVGLMSLAILWKLCGGADGSSLDRADEDERVAALERADGRDGAAGRDGADGGGGEHAGGDGNEHAEGGGGGNDRADGANPDADADEDRAGAVDDADQMAEDEDADEAAARGEALDTDDDEDLQIEPGDDAAGEAEAGSASQATRSGGGSPKPLPASTQSADRAAEDAMSAEELLAAAKEAYKKGKARDAYRLANLSNQKKKSEEAVVLKANSACRMKNKDLAKSAYKTLPMGEKRREVRQTCREQDIRLGL